MALTTLEEAQVRALLSKNNELLDLADNQVQIIAELGAQDTTIQDLPESAGINPGDFIIVHKASGEDTKALGKFIGTSKSHLLYQSNLWP